MALIALGVCGGIGAYKSVEIVRGLQKEGHDVTAVMTRSARQFVGRLTFEAITRHRVLTSQFEPGANADIEHIALASEYVRGEVRPVHPPAVEGGAAGGYEHPIDVEPPLSHAFDNRQPLGPGSR